MLSNKACLRLVSRPDPCKHIFHTRDFSQTAKRWRTTTLPTFEESSSPELTTLLATFREEKLIPRSLNKEQRKLVFSEKLKPRLQTEVIKATIGDEEVRLKHVDRHNDKNLNQILREAVRLASTEADWRNVVAIAQGVKRSSMTQRPFMREFIVRKLLEARQYTILLSALRNVDDIGITLADPAIACQAVIGIYPGVLPDFELEKIDAALKYGETLVEIFELEPHGGARKLTNTDWRVRPTTLGPALALTAVKVKKYQGSVDEDGKLQLYATRVLDMWDQGAKNAGYLTPSDDIQLVSLGQHLRLWIPLWHGLTLSRNILGVQMPRPKILEDALSRIEQMLDVAYARYTERRRPIKSPAPTEISMWNDLKSGKLVLS